MSVSTMVRFAVPLIIGFVAGSAIAEANATTRKKSAPKKTRTLEDIVRKKLRDQALEALRFEKVDATNMDVTTFLSELYRALYTLGRCGNRLPDSMVDPLSVHMKHLHRQRDTKRDQKIADWYQTVGVGASEPLLDLLATHPAAKPYDTRYIVAALGEYVPGLDHSGLASELMPSFGKTPSAVAA